MKFLIRNKAKEDDELLVSKYFTLAMNELETLEANHIRSYLPELERATISNIRGNIYSLKQDYWRDRIERRPWKIPKFAIEFVKVLPVETVLGSPETEKGRDANEAQYNGELGSTVWVSKYEITQHQYEYIMNDLPSSFTSIKKNRPVEMISWNDAMEFCRKLTAAQKEIAQLTSDLEYRLLTEEEWEIVCRAGTTTPYSVGPEITHDQADFSSTTNPEVVGPGKFRRGTKVVGSYKPNPYGLYDMHGNVAEWCLDSFKENRLDENELADTNLKTVKGGGWFDTANELRSAYRDSSNKLNRFDNVGFRIILGPKLSP